MKNALKQAFVEDHRRLMRGLVELRNALAANDIGLARSLADALDIAVGPHIEFEERCFYPALKSALGGKFVSQLYHEHGSGKKVLAHLIELASDKRLNKSERGDIDEGIAEALQHAYSCGTLVSHIDRFEPARQKELLEKLDTIRARGARWTQLPRSTRDAIA